MDPGSMHVARFPCESGDVAPQLPSSSARTGGCLGEGAALSCSNIGHGRAVAHVAWTPG